MKTINELKSNDIPRVRNDIFESILNNKIGKIDPVIKFTEYIRVGEELIKGKTYVFLPYFQPETVPEGHVRLIIENTKEIIDIPIEIFEQKKLQRYCYCPASNF